MQKDMPPQTYVLILGMHRSGTSALTGSLQQHGLFLGEVFESSPFNKKGNRENAEVMRLNDLVLSHNKHSWNNPPDSMIVWTDEHIKPRDQIIKKYQDSGQSMCGFKDPRTLFTLEFWQEGLSQLDIKYVGSFRHPLSVAQSMWHRDKMPILDGLKLWEKYNTRLLNLMKKTDFPLISFDVSAQEYQYAIHCILRNLGILTSASHKNKFFDDSLRHEIANSETKLPDDIDALYNKLIKKYKEQIS